MTHDRAATLAERAAFLLALFARNQMFHGSYVVEKLEVAFAEGIKPATLEALLDSWNRKRYRLALDRRAWQRARDDEECPSAWERAWTETEEEERDE